MTLNERIDQDLTELYNGLEISAAKTLTKLIKVSTRGLPQHFVGDRNAKTVLVMLNPGGDAKEADRNVRCATIDYDRSDKEAFIRSYAKDKKYFGKKDKDRTDHFDIKQAAFLKPWKEAGIDLPAGFPRDKATHLAAKESVLMRKLQLELVPYASRSFDLNRRKNPEPLFQFVKTMLEEIFRKDRSIVIFGAGLFERIFIAYNKHIGENVFSVGPVRHSDPLKPGGKLRGKCRMVEICFKGEKRHALIANTFASRALSQAYELMERYGRFCASVLQRCS